METIVDWKLSSEAWAIAYRGNIQGMVSSVVRRSMWGTRTGLKRTSIRIPVSRFPSPFRLWQILLQREFPLESLGMAPNSR